MSFSKTREGDPQEAHHHRRLAAQEDDSNCNPQPKARSISIEMPSHQEWRPPRLKAQGPRHCPQGTRSDTYLNPPKGTSALLRGSQRHGSWEPSA
uniref:Uncharacterized protein n=1 Tax=Cannabis sativa TaxID=3483 RepID=A0A803QQ58_CANSA